MAICLKHNQNIYTDKSYTIYINNDFEPQHKILCSYFMKEIIIYDTLVGHEKLTNLKKKTKKTPYNKT